MTAAVSGADAGHGNKPLHACRLHGVDQDAGGFRKEACAFKDKSGRKVDADDWMLVNVLEGIRIVSRSSACPTAYRGPHLRLVCLRLNVPGHGRCGRLEGQSSPFQARCRGWRL